MARACRLGLDSRGSFGVARLPGDENSGSRIDAGTGVVKARRDVVLDEIWEFIQHLRTAQSVGEKVKYVADSYPQATNAGAASALR